MSAGIRRESHTVSCQAWLILYSREVIPNGPSVRARCLSGSPARVSRVGVILRANRPGGIGSAALREVTTLALTACLQRLVSQSKACFVALWLFSSGQLRLCGQTRFAALESAAPCAFGRLFCRLSFPPCGPSVA